MKEKEEDDILTSMNKSNQNMIKKKIRLKSNATIVNK